MPKDEFDFEDPLELNGVAFPTGEDTTDLMGECFIEEYLLMGYGPKQILELFKNPQYLGMNLVLEKRGEQFIRDKIAHVCGHWGKPASCSTGEKPQRGNEPVGAAIPKGIL